MNHKLEAALEAADMTQSELARRLGIHVSHVNRWVQRKLRPTTEQLLAAMGELGAEDPIALGYRIDGKPTVADD